jgi:hypothetical protein
VKDQTGKRPECPFSIIPGANQNYKWGTLQQCKETCFNEPTGHCNALSRYGEASKSATEPWHCRFYACADPSNFTWVTQDQWGNYPEEANTYLLPIRHYQEETCTNIINNTRWVDKTRWVNKTRWINNTRWADKTRWVNKTRLVNKTQWINDTRIVNKTRWTDKVRWVDKIRLINKTRIITIYKNVTTKVEKPTGVRNESDQMFRDESRDVPSFPVSGNSSCCDCNEDLNTTLLSWQIAAGGIVVLFLLYCGLREYLCSEIIESIEFCEKIANIFMCCKEICCGEEDDNDQPRDTEIPGERSFEVHRTYYEPNPMLVRERQTELSKKRVEI